MEIAKKDKNRYILLDCINRNIKSINDEIIDNVNKYYGID